MLKQGILVPQIRMEIQNQIVENIKNSKAEYKRAIYEAKTQYEDKLDHINLMMGI